MSLPKSIKIGYAVFFDHIHTPELLRARSAQLFDWITEGKLRIRIGGEYAAIPQLLSPPDDDTIIRGSGPPTSYSANGA